MVLVFDEECNLAGVAILREILKGLEPLWSGAAGTAPAAAKGRKPAAEAPVETVMRPVRAFVEPGASVAGTARLLDGHKLIPVLEDNKKLSEVLRWQEDFQKCSRAALGG